MAGESVLAPLELGPLGEPFDRRDLAPARDDCEVTARADREAVDEDRACAADLHVARALRAGKPERVAEDVEQQLLRLDLPHDGSSVEATGELHRALHPRASPA